MRLIRVFVESTLAPGIRVDAGGTAATHMTRVLRLVAGDRVTVFNGDGNDYPARIAAIRGSRVDIEVLEQRQARPESPLALRLVQGIARAERMDLIVQKATELGVVAIQPVMTARSVVRLDAKTTERRVAHWRGIVIAACEQCGRARLPAVAVPLPLSEWLAQPALESVRRLQLAVDAPESLGSAAAGAGSIELLIGPEGGLDESEQRSAANAGYRSCSIGPRVLRTETAALAALAVLAGHRRRPWLNETQERTAPAEHGLRLLLDPYLCFGPGTEPVAPTLSAIAARSAALGLALCVEEQSWTEAATDPDVLRRGVDLARFEPLTRIADLPLPSARDLTARFMPARSELDKADLWLLGALHARRAELLIADDGRLHRLAKRAGLGARVVTAWDTLAWLDSLAGRPREITVTEAGLPAALADPALARMLAEECEPFDPCLASRLETAGSRMLVASEAGTAVAIGLLVPEAGGLTLVALASADTARGHRALEPIVGAALTTARRLRIALAALLPPHQDHALLLLDLLGFERRGRDRHGREIFCHALDDAAARPAAQEPAWLLPLDAASHDNLAPELAGASQTELFCADLAAQTPGSPVRRQLLRTSSAQEPSEGDLLLLFHQRTADRIRSTSITAAARVTRVQQACDLPELLALTAGRDGASMTRQREMLDAGTVSVMDLYWLGRLARPLALSALIERGIIVSTPSVALRLEPAALQRLAPELVLA